MVSLSCIYTPKQTRCMDPKGSRNSVIEYIIIIQFLIIIYFNILVALILKDRYLYSQVLKVLVINYTWNFQLFFNLYKNIIYFLYKKVRESKDIIPIIEARLIKENVSC